MKVQVAPKEEFSVNAWKTIKQRIDLEYERKLKEVSDAALQKLQHFQAEHKQLLEKTQFLMDTSQIADDE